MKRLILSLVLLTGCKTQLTSDIKDLNKFEIGFYNLENQNVKKLSCDGQLLQNKSNLKPVAFSLKLDRVEKNSLCEVTYNKSKYQDPTDPDQHIVLMNMAGFSSFCNSFFKAFYFNSPLNAALEQPAQRDGDEYKFGPVAFDRGLKYITITFAGTNLKVDYEQKEVFNLPQKFIMAHSSEELQSTVTTSVFYQTVSSTAVPQSFRTTVQESGSKKSEELVYNISNCKVFK